MNIYCMMFSFYIFQMQIPRENLVYVHGSAFCCLLSILYLTIGQSSAYRWTPEKIWVLLVSENKFNSFYTQAKSYKLTSHEWSGKHMTFVRYSSCLDSESKLRKWSRMSAGKLWLGFAQGKCWICCDASILVWWITPYHSPMFANYFVKMYY